MPRLVFRRITAPAVPPLRFSTAPPTSTSPAPGRPMRHLLSACCAVFAISGCSTANSASSSVSISEVTGQIVDRLEQVGTLEIDAATHEWSLAHDSFERQLEPVMRHNLPPGQILAIEYRFGRLGAVLGEAEAEEEAHRLGEALVAGVASIDMNMR